MTVSNSLIKYLSVIICDSLHRNINDNFLSVSFEVIKNGEIKIRIVLKDKTKIEEEYIDDILAEFEAAQGLNNLSDIEVIVDVKTLPLSYVVYSHH